jgi:hypothetical protein
LPDFANSTNVTELEELFHKYVRETDVKCPLQMRFGNKEEGGWSMCFVSPFGFKNQSCLIYSFGINHEWSFDDDVVRRYGCEVKAFDPSMGKADHRRGDKIWFYNAGIAGNDAENNGRGWKVRTLGSFYKELNDTSKVIDYLKIDVEYSEWDALETALRDNPVNHVLDFTKQLGLEIHTHELYGQVSTLQLYIKFSRIFRELQALGFLRWDTHTNPTGKYVSKHCQKQMHCCFEIIFININYLLRT